MKSNRALAAMDRAIGTWTVTGSHPMLPGRTLPGRVTFERVEDGAFIRMHSKMDDPEMPEGVAYFGTDGDDDACIQIYFDVRGVARHYQVTFQQDGFSWSRDARELSQRFRITFADDGTMAGEGMMKKQDGEWEPDLRLSYVRSKT